jgi:hypothetical protein
MKVVLHGAAALPRNDLKGYIAAQAILDILFRVVKINRLAVANHQLPVRDESSFPQKRFSTETMKAPQIRQLLRRSEQCA